MITIEDGKLEISERKLLAEYSLAFFLSEYLPAHYYVNFGTHHIDLIKDLEELPDYKRLLKIFPREHAKTAITSIGFVIWCICYNKRKNIVIASETKGQAIEFLSAIRSELEINRNIHRDFGDFSLNANEWAKTRIQTTNNVRVSAVSTNSSTRGAIYNAVSDVPNPNYNGNNAKVIQETRLTRPDLIICDDILNEKIVKNQEIREATKKWYKGDLLNLLNSDVGWMIVIGTIFHQDDLLMDLWNNKDDMTDGWRKTYTPACEMCVDDFNNVLSVKNILWEDYWTKEKLIERRKAIGSVMFSREFLLLIIDDALKYFRKEWWGRFYINELPTDLVVTTVVDPAIGEKRENDYTVIMTVGYSQSTEKFYILDIDRVKTTPGRYISLLLDQYSKWSTKFDHIGLCIEVIAFQKALIEPLEREMKRRSIYASIFTASPSTDKIIRVSKVSPIAERSDIRLPLDNHCRGWVELFIGEADSFPKGKHDDQLDACHIAIIMLKPYAHILDKVDLLEEVVRKPFGY